MQDCKKLADFFYADNVELVTINFQKSKHPVWSKDDWPQDIIEAALNKIISEPFEVEEVYFAHNSKGARGLHVDTSDIYNEKNWLAILFPLEFIGPAHTLLFDNFYNGANSRFSLDSATDKTVVDRSQISNYDPSIIFDKNIYSKYLSYMDVNDLHGFTLEMIYEWNVGDALVFERQQIHAQGDIDDYKLSLVIFVNKL